MSAAGAGLRAEGGPDPKKRALAAVLVLLAVIAVAIVLFRGDGGYRVTAEFVNAGQLVKGNEVKAGGVAVGSVKDIDVTQDGRAKVTLGIDETDTAVELDEICAMFDERTRKGLQDFFKGSGEMLRGRGKGLRRGVHY